MKFYVVIDTNVLVSSVLKPNSNPGIIYNLIEQGIIIPLINEKIRSDYIEVLNRPKFHLPNNLVNKIVNNMIKNAITIDEKHIDIELIDEKDRVFYEVTMKSNEDRESMLVTGNMKHFPTKPFILTPKELCDIIFKKINDNN